MKQESNLNIEKTIEEYEIKQKEDRNQKVILIIIIILLLLLLCLLSYRLGKIGYVPVNSNATGDDIQLIKVTSDDIEVTKDTKLDIFKNEKFENKSIIAPRSEGSYKFCVKNVTDKNIVYDIFFTEEMRLPINMKYRLKIDNLYIKGSKDNYIDIEQLNVENITVLKDSVNVFTLEWYWEDDDESDTYVGSLKNDEYYTLKINIQPFERSND